MKKPFDTYFGSKEVNGTLHTIINHIPVHKNYIEGFLGNGAIMRYKQPAAINIGIDFDACVIDKWNEGIHGANFCFVHGDFLELFKIISVTMDPKETFIYLDPPYMKATRSSGKRYHKELCDQGHEVLLSMLQHSRFRIMISTYDNDAYKSKLSMWSSKSFPSITRGGVRTETIYWNYAITELNEYNFLGDDFTERQRIKRKISRLHRKLQELPILERAALVQSVTAMGTGSNSEKQLSHLG